MIWDSLQLSSDKGDYFLFVTSTWTHWLHSCRILKTMNLYVEFGIELLVYLINVQTMKTCFHSTTIFTKMLQQVTLEIVSIQKRCREQYGLYNNLETPAFKLQIWCSVCLFCNLVFHIITSIDHRYWSILFCKYTYSFHKRRMFESYYYVDGQSKKIIPSKHIEYIQHCLSIDEKQWVDTYLSIKRKT